MYMPFAGPQYLREMRGRPLHALASRICSMNEVLHLPPWMNAWMVSEARRCDIDAALILMPPGNRLSQSGVYLTAQALESAGVPTLTVSADMVASAGWDREQFVARVAGFLANAKLL
jgi:ABC-type taurine transport system substrate-binding protein